MKWSPCGNSIWLALNTHLVLSYQVPLASGNSGLWTAYMFIRIAMREKVHVIASADTICRHNLTWQPHINGLVQERRNSSALAMELRLSCTNSFSSALAMELRLSCTNSSIWHCRSSTMAEVMVCCLMAPSHYHRNSWLIVNQTPRNTFHWNLTFYANIFIKGDIPENVVCKMADILSRPRWPCSSQWGHSYCFHNLIRTVGKSITEYYLPLKCNAIWQDLSSHFSK